MRCPNVPGAAKLSAVQRIVVGVEDSGGARAALAWAVEEGRVRGARVEALLAWSYLAQPSIEEDEGFDPGFDERRAEALLARVVDDVVGASPTVDVERRVVCDLPAHALVEASEDADLLVVGRRGRGGFRGLLLGSVSQQCAHHARCPVVLVPHENTAR